MTIGLLIRCWLILSRFADLRERTQAMASIRKRKNLKGETTYTVQVRLKGYPNEVASFTRLTDAKKWAQSTEAAIRENRYFQHSEAKKHTVADMNARYLTWLELHNAKRLKDVKPMLNWWTEQIGDYLLSDLKPSLINLQIDKLMQRKVKRRDRKTGKTNFVSIGPGRINRYLAVLSRACTIAVKDWEWLDDNPMRKVTRMQEPEGRVRFLSDEERHRLLDACKKSSHPNLYLIVVLAISTGMRRGEIMNLRWSQINHEKKQIVLYRTKNGSKRVVPLRGLAWDLVQQHHKVRHLKTTMLFPSTIEADTPYDIKKPWEAALALAEIEDFRFHDLRHSAASYLAMNKASLTEMADVLGHKTLEMVKRYAHLSEAHTGDVVADMNERIFGNA